MHWMEAINRYPWPLYLLGGLFLGTFLGYQVLPQLLPKPAVVATEVESAPQLQARQQLETRLAAGLKQFAFVKDAHVQLSVSLAGTRKAHAKAVVTLTTTSTSLSEEQLHAIAEQVASGVNGMGIGVITILDASGQLLNGESVLRHERKVFWTGIAINVAKVLGILAALVTLNFVIEAIGRGVNGEGTC
jgi:hypothetical protein